MTAYVPDTQGRWIALVRGDAAVLLPRSADAVDALWEALAAPDAVGAVLGRLTHDGLADVPPFALVAAAGDRRRIVVRGGFRATAGDEEITATGVSTWVERVVPADAPFELAAPFAPAADDDVWTIVEGVVPAAVVRSGTPGVDASRPASSASSAVTAETEVVSEHTIAPEATIAPESAVPSETTLAPGDRAHGDDAVDDELADDETVVVARRRAPEASTGDHDGLTIAVTAMQKLRRAKAGASLGAGAAPAPAPRPESPPVTLRLPGGAVESLTGEIVLGRSPSVNRATGTKLPRLVTIGAGDPDISRSHVRIAVEGGTIVVTDLHSRNGTTVVQPGRPPVKLRGGEPTPVLVGTVVDLGGGFEITVAG